MLSEAETPRNMQPRLKVDSRWLPRLKKHIWEQKNTLDVSHNLYPIRYTIIYNDHPMIYPIILFLWLNIFIGGMVTIPKWVLKKLIFLNVDVDGLHVFFWIIIIIYMIDFGGIGCESYGIYHVLGSH